MNRRREDGARTTRPSARPDRLHTVPVPSTGLDLVLLGIVVLLALSIVAAPSPGLADGRHVLALTALAVLIIRALHTEGAHHDQH